MFQALLFPPPREARATPYAGKRGTGDEARYSGSDLEIDDVNIYLCMYLFFMYAVTLRNAA